jgi:hypothetical protein
LTRGNLRAVDQDIKLTARELSHARLQFQNRLLNRHVKREEGDTGLFEMVAGFEGQQRSNGNQTLALVFGDEGFTNATLATSRLIVSNAVNLRSW